MKFSTSITIVLLSPLATAAVITKAAECSPLEMVIARGTTEPGKYGFIVGDPLARATKKLIPGSTAFAIPYPASFNDESPAKGIKATIKHLTEQAAACPNQKFVLVGYSQGAAVMHYVASKIAPDILSRIIAATMFGDPGMPGITTDEAKTPGGIKKLGPIPPFPGKLSENAKYNCRKGDPVCGAGDNVVAHLLYMNDKYVPDSAAFIAAKFKSG